MELRECDIEFLREYVKVVKDNNLDSDSCNKVISILYASNPDFKKTYGRNNMDGCICDRCPATYNKKENLCGPSKALKKRAERIKNFLDTKTNFGQREFIF